MSDENLPASVPPPEPDKPFTRKKRIHTLMDMPNYVLDDINKIIDDGWKSPRIWNMLKAKYGNELKKIPCRVTIDRYIRWYEGQKAGVPDAELGLIQDTKAIQEGLATVLDPNTPVMDKKAVLEALVRKCGDRITTLEKWQRTTISPQFENCLVRYFAEIRALVETLAKLNNELAPDQSMVVNIVDSQIPPIFQAFYNVLKDVCPEKLEYIKMRVKEELRRTLTGGQRNGQIAIEKAGA